MVNIFDKAALPEPDGFSKASHVFVKAVGKGFDNLTQVNVYNVCACSIERPMSLGSILCLHLILV